MTIKHLVDEWNKKLENQNMKAVPSLYFPTRKLEDVIQLLGGVEILYIDATGNSPRSATYEKIDVPLHRTNCRVAIYEAVENDRKRGWIQAKEPTTKDLQIFCQTAQKHGIIFNVGKLIIQTKMLGSIELEKHSAREESPLTEDVKAQRFLKGLKVRGNKWQSLDVAFHDPEKLELLKKELPELTLRLCSVSKSQVIKYDTHCLIPDVERKGKKEEASSS